MKILLSPSGSHGDVRPMAVLGIGLKQEGHEVIICSSPEHEEFFTKYELKFFPVGMNIKERMQKEPNLATGNNLKSVKAQKKYFAQDFPAQVYGLLKAAKGVDCIIGGGVSMAGRSVAEYYKLPYGHVIYIPRLLRSANRIPFQYSEKERSKALVRCYWALGDIAHNWALKGVINKTRKEFSLPPISNAVNYYTDDAIVAIDEELGKVDSGVALRYMQSSYWHLEEEGELDKELTDFIEAGPKPVYIGFGSMSDEDPENTKQILNEVIGCKDLRFIISKGWANILDNAKGENVKIIDYVPHSKLFPKMAAVAHHGGAGTVHTVALAGVPQIVIPHLPDHPYWGFRIHELNLGPKAILRSTLTGHNLIAAINEAIENDSYKKSAEKMAETLRKKDNAGEAKKVLDWIINNKA